MGILLIIIAVILIVGVMSYNKIVRLLEAVKTDKENIAVQLDERNKLFDSLINAVKKYLTHENETLTKIVELRNGKHSNEEISQAITSGALNAGLQIAVEAYPELKSSTNMLQLQESIESIERRLANTKKTYNSSVEAYYSCIKSFPALIVAGMFSSLNQTFERWTLSGENIETAEKRIVEF